jgi:hypothetical protein
MMTQGFMPEVAPYLKDECVIQAIGGEKRRFPLAACELVVAPGATAVVVRQIGS